MRRRVNSFSPVLTVVVLALFCLSCANADTTVIVRDDKALQALFAAPVASIIVSLLPGEYHLSPSPIIDSTCGNCENAATPVEATVGLHLRGKKVHIVGPNDGSATIHTHAGYGIFFDRCDDGLIENVTITGGERDTNGMATDAAIVAKHSNVVVRNNRITNNIGDSATVAQKIVGVMGICGRENSRLTISHNEIVRNSWDGIALYRDARATIEDNIVDGVDKARGAHIGGGRGVGIGVTWNAAAVIRNNLVTRYWKGIGLFVDAHGVVERNIVEDIITWGIAYWDADKGKPVGYISDNVIYNTGACGASITRSRAGGDPGKFTGNVIVKTAQNEKYDSPDYYCYQCALAVHAAPEGFVIERNLFYNNRRATPDLPDFDIPKEEFLHAIAPRCAELARMPAFRNSRFLQDFAR